MVQSLIATGKVLTMGPDMSTVKQLARQAI